MLRIAGLAQLVEHLICNQRVGGSSPSTGTTKLKPPIRAVVSQKLSVFADAFCDLGCKCRFFSFFFLPF